jgi:hypothetical protein
MEKTDAERDTRETVPERDREQNQKERPAQHRAKENEIEAELDNESGRRPHFKPE